MTTKKVITLEFSDFVPYINKPLTDKDKTSIDYFIWQSMGKAESYTGKLSLIIEVVKD